MNSVSFHPDGNCVAVGTTDNVVKVTKSVSMVTDTTRHYDALLYSDMGCPCEQVTAALFRYTYVHRLYYRVCYCLGGRVVVEAYHSHLTSCVFLP